MSTMTAKYGLEFKVFMLVERVIKRGNPARLVIEIR